MTKLETTHPSPSFCVQNIVRVHPGPGDARSRKRKAKEKSCVVSIPQHTDRYNKSGIIVVYLGRRQLESLNSSVAACYVSVIRRAASSNSCPQLQVKETKHPLFCLVRASEEEWCYCRSIRLVSEDSELRVTFCRIRRRANPASALHFRHSYHV